MQWADLLGSGGLVALGGIIIGGIVALLPKKGSIENQRLVQFQSDLNQEREEREKLGARIDLLEESLIWFRRRDVAWERREALLMTGVEQGKFPPWPERVGILNEVRHD